MVNNKLSAIQRKVLKLYEFDNKVVNDDSLLLSRYWWAYDKWNPGDDLYTNLKKVTPAESITRSRRWLHEHGYIKYSKDADKRREEQFKEKTREYSGMTAVEEMRIRLKNGEL